MKRFVFLLAGLLLIASSLRAQTSVSGTITSPDGKPVAGASIIIEGSTVGATSDAKGFYRIKVRSSKDILVLDRKSTRLNSSHPNPSRMPSSA